MDDNEPDHFVKLPIEVMCSALLGSQAKLIYAALADKVSYCQRLGQIPTIHRHQIEAMTGCSRSARERALSNLREYGLIRDEGHTIWLTGSFTRLRVEREERTKYIEAVFKETENRIEGKKEIVVLPKPKSKEPEEVLEELRQAWNKYKPENYAEIKVASNSLQRSVDTHIRNLNLKPKSYDEFFQVLCAGIKNSKFWGQENSRKQLVSVTGNGAPIQKKLDHVVSLYNDGLESLDIDQSTLSVHIPRRLQSQIESAERFRMHYAQRIQALVAGKVIKDATVRENILAEYKTDFEILKGLEQQLLDLGVNPTLIYEPLNIPEDIKPGLVKEPKKGSTPRKKVYYEEE